MGFLFIKRSEHELSQDRRKRQRAVARARSKARSSLPAFPRPYHWVRVKLGDSWRRPKGIDNKLRHAFKGYPATVNIGRRTPKSIRGIHPSGLLPVLVTNQKELVGLDPSVNCIILSSKLGSLRFSQIEAVATERGFLVVNAAQKTEGGSGQQPENAAPSVGPASSEDEEKAGETPEPAATVSAESSEDLKASLEAKDA